MVSSKRTKYNSYLKTVSEAVVGLNLLYPKNFQKQFSAFLKALKFQTICSHKTYAIELSMFGVCLVSISMISS